MKRKHFFIFLVINDKKQFSYNFLPLKITFHGALILFKVRQAVTNIKITKSNIYSFNCL